ncbi:MAG: rRNA pseudouridine synthase [Desulfofustis sp.]|nr:rRNA pseudouridine synthase [Desulfofustis sp.]
MKGAVRLQKYLADCGIASRRKAEELIASGRVSVDGAVVTGMGSKIDPARQVVRFDGEVVKPDTDLIYILMNKPKGYVTTLSDPQGRPVVTSLLKQIDARVFPVGRLDIDTEGALLLTNDGGLAQKVQHPSHETNKTYEVIARGTVKPETIAALEAGIVIDGRKTWPAKISRVRRQAPCTSLQITIHEGRKRQVRRMFQAVGHPVVNLKRVAYGKLRLGGLKSGSYRFLGPEDLKKIYL